MNKAYRTTGSSAGSRLKRAALWVVLSTSSVWAYAQNTIESVTGGVAPLNHRLPADIPSGSRGSEALAPGVSLMGFFGPESPWDSTQRWGVNPGLQRQRHRGRQPAPSAARARAARRRAA